MTAALLVMLAAAAADGFRAVQYTAKPVSLRGCADCKGEPDDVCEIRPGAQVLSFEEYARLRWPAPGRIKLLRPSAEAGCAVTVKALFGPRAPVELAAVRLAASPPSTALLEKLRLRTAVRGWPHRPPRHVDAAIAAAPQRTALRAAVVCWPSEHGWPMAAAAHPESAAALDATNSCEWWLLSVNAAGEPDLSGASFAIDEPAFAAGAARWAHAFDIAAPLDESLLAGAPAPAPLPAPVAAAPVARCGEAARERTATLDRFDQWDLQIRHASTPSLDRAALTLPAASWSGHCQELEVLRAALEQQLECSLTVEGHCVGAESFQR
jgi:hypothetical protein